MQLRVMLLVLAFVTSDRLPQPEYDVEYEDFLENRMARYGY